MKSTIVLIVTLAFVVKGNSAAYPPPRGPPGGKPPPGRPEGGAKFPGHDDPKRQAYLADIGKFKEMVKKCNTDGDATGLLSRAEVMACMANPEYGPVIKEMDENKDGELSKEEMKNQVTRIREKHVPGSTKRMNQHMTTPTP